MRLRELRIAANLTQADVANYLGVSHVAVVRWEQGKAYPSTGKLPLLAKLFGCSIDDLFLSG